MQRQQPGSISGDQLEMFLVVACPLYAKRNASMQKEKLQFNEMLAGKGL
jgi:hypothetical protein